MCFIESTSGTGFDPGINGHTVTQNSTTNAYLTIGDAALYGNPNGQSFAASGITGAPGAAANFAIFHMPNRVNAGFMDGHAETLICEPYTATFGSGLGQTALSLERYYNGGAGFVLTPYQP